MPARRDSMKAAWPGHSSFARFTWYAVLVSRRRSHGTWVAWHAQSRRRDRRAVNQRRGYLSRGSGRKLPALDHRMREVYDMIDRRLFLNSVLGLAFGGLGSTDRPGGDPPRSQPTDDLADRQYLADVAACNMNVFGIPRRRSLVERGLHPVAPERVIVIDDAALRRFRSSRHTLKHRFREEGACWLKRWPNTPPLPSAKLDLSVALMDQLTAYYQRPELFGKWSRTLWRRELLGSTGFGRGLGLLHDFQCDTTVRTDNGVVDWWLVLLPGGVDWQALDDRPVHYMVGPVMEERQPGPYVRVMEAVSRGLRPLALSEGFDPASWSARLASLPAANAAREVNFVVARWLAAVPARSDS